LPESLLVVVVDNMQGCYNLFSQHPDRKTVERKKSGLLGDGDQHTVLLERGWGQFAVRHVFRKEKSQVCSANLEKGDLVSAQWSVGGEELHQRGILNDQELKVAFLSSASSPNPEYIPKVRAYIGDLELIMLREVTQRLTCSPPLSIRSFQGGPQETGLCVLPQE